MNLLSSSVRRSGGFTLVEVVFVAAMSVAVFGAAALSFRAISVQQTRATNYGKVTIGSDNLENFYGVTGTDGYNTWHAPNYGRGIRSEELRELFYLDVETASAVFALPRAGRSGATPSTPIRPATLNLPAVTAGLQVDTPASFLSVLSSGLNYPDAATVFSSYTGLPPATAKNASVFVIQPNPTGDAFKYQLTIRSVWEIDYAEITDGGTLKGTYATVRRYVGPAAGGTAATLTHYYDIFYKDQSMPNSDQNFPAVVSFEKAARGTSAYHRAANQPFYFMWWPDPASRTFAYTGAAASKLNGTAVAATNAASGYALHYGQSSLFLTFPMFPAAR